MGFAGCVGLQGLAAVGFFRSSSQLADELLMEWLPVNNIRIMLQGNTWIHEDFQAT